MKKILLGIASVFIIFLLIFSIMIWREENRFHNLFYISIVNRIDSGYYLAVIFEERRIIQHIWIDPHSRFSKTLRVNYSKYLRDMKPVYITLQLRENRNASPIWEEVFYFPCGGIDTLSIRGGLVIDMVIFMEGDEIKYFMTSP